MYIDITRKLYAYGMPGIAIVSVIGEHAITLDEFKMITKSVRVKSSLLFIKNGSIVIEIVKLLIIVNIRDTIQ